MLLKSQLFFYVPSSILFKSQNRMEKKMPFDIEQELLYLKCKIWQVKLGRFISDSLFKPNMQLFRVFQPKNCIRSPSTWNFFCGIFLGDWCQS